LRLSTSLPLPNTARAVTRLRWSFKGTLVGAFFEVP
jgi:hypothetical protein